MIEGSTVVSWPDRDGGNPLRVSVLLGRGSPGAPVAAPGGARLALSRFRQVRALRNSAVPMPAKMMLAVHAASAAGSRSACAKATAMECTTQ